MAILKNTTIADTGNLRLPVGTTAQRPAPVAGQFRYNTTTNGVEIYTGGANAWLPAATRGVRATGGNVYDVDVEGTTYRVHVFTATGNSTFNVTRPGNVEYLIVAGGGSGGFDNAGGGGAGGLLTGTTTVSPQTYTINVGAGGINNQLYNYRGPAGSDSSAFGLTAIGGGGGGGGDNGGAQSGTNFANSQLAGGSGGSGGGGASEGGDGAGGLGTTGQGNNGGAGLLGSGGGGGGAGSPGTSATAATNPGNGGSGIASSITGVLTFYAGGGGGGTENSTNAAADTGVPGLGGGFGGALNRARTPGTPNTGGGGGGEANGNPVGDGSGGSGIVVVRYALHSEPGVAAPKVTGDGLVLDLDFAKPTVYAGSGTLVNDSRVNGINGTINGSVPFINSRTQRSAMSFNLTASNNILLSNNAIPTGNFITIVIWNFGRTQNQSSIISGTQSGGTTTQALNIHLPWSDGNVYWDIGDPFGRLFVNVSAIYQGWHHWVFTHNATAGTKRIYHDGIQIASSTDQTMTIPQIITTRIGAFTSLNYGHNGDVASLSIYNRELSAAEVVDNFNTTRWRFGV